jgi:hypothetical protein
MVTYDHLRYLIFFYNHGYMSEPILDFLGDNHGYQPRLMILSKGGFGAISNFFGVDLNACFSYYILDVRVFLALKFVLVLSCPCFLPCFLLKHLNYLHMARHTLG